MITWDCPTCGARLSVSDDKGGKKGVCPKCKNVMIVPEAPTEPTTPTAPPPLPRDPLAALAAASAPRAGPAPRRPRRSYRPAQSAVNSLAVASLCIGICVWPLMFIPVLAVLCVPLSVVGLVLGVLALAVRGKKGGGTVAMTVLGLVFSTLMFVLMILPSLAFLSFMAAT